MGLARSRRTPALLPVLMLLTVGRCDLAQTIHASNGQSTTGEWLQHILTDSPGNVAHTQKRHQPGTPIPASLPPPPSFAGALVTTPASVQQYASFAPPEGRPKPLLFVVVRSKDTNTALRATVRRTWLNLKEMGLEDKLAYRFFIDRHGCCREELATERDLVVLDSEWLHRNFTSEYGEESGYKDLAWGGINDEKMNYARDWDVNAILWAVDHYDFKYILNVDDDALLCSQNMVYQLSQLPRNLSSFMFGFNRWDCFDNCFVMMTRDLADFFHSSYYTKLRPTHRSGATFGGGWCKIKGRWAEVFAAHGFDIVRRPGEPSCVPRCLLGEAQMDHCAHLKDDWVRRCTPQIWQQCALQDCLPQEHVCHGFSPVDHRVHTQAWRVMSEDPPNWYRDPTRICIDKLFLDKLKQIDVMETWWRAAWPQNQSVQHEFKDFATYLTHPSRLNGHACLQGHVGRDIDQRNLRHPW